jgi:hypothetical protein
MCCAQRAEGSANSSPTVALHGMYASSQAAPGWIPYLRVDSNFEKTLAGKHTETRHAVHGSRDCAAFVMRS